MKIVWFSFVDETITPDFQSSSQYRLQGSICPCKLYLKGLASQVWECKYLASASTISYGFIKLDYCNQTIGAMSTCSLYRSTGLVFDDPFSCLNNHCFPIRPFWLYKTLGFLNMHMISCPDPLHLVLAHKWL